MVAMLVGSADLPSSDDRIEFPGVVGSGWLTPRDEASEILIRYSFCWLHLENPK